MVSYGFYFCDLQDHIYTSDTFCDNNQKWEDINALCMVFHVRWLFLTMSLRIPPESLETRVGFGDEWWEIHLTWNTIQYAFSGILYTSRHVNLAKYITQSWRSRKPCEMDLSHNCTQHGGCRTYAKGYVRIYSNMIRYDLLCALYRVGP